MQVASLVDIRVVAIHQLQHFAFGDDIGRIGQHFHHAGVADLNHHLEGAGVQEIADENARRIAEQGVGGRSTPPQGRFVHHVVVQERRRMDELDDGGQPMVRIAAITECAGRQDDQRGPQPLAASFDDVVRDLAHESHVGMQARPNDLVDRLHVGGDTGTDGFDGHRGRGKRAQGRRRR